MRSRQWTDRRKRLVKRVPDGSAAARARTSGSSRAPQLGGVHPRGAAAAVDERDPAVDIEREQRDVGGIQKALRPVLRLFALDGLVLDLVNTANLRRQRHEQVLVFLAEGPSLITDQAEPAERMGGRRNRCRQK